ncbi:MAG: hypothetical protein Q8M94_03745 [Ignavibacteria bacterium]|nr:hypothetical protein [Ignavibacteria bacterium]
MKIERIYKGELVVWGEVSLEECIEKTEGKGYYLPGSVEKLLQAGQAVGTPFAVFRRMA